MRIISQGGALDMPYEMVSLEIIAPRKDLRYLYKKGFMVIALTQCDQPNLCELTKNRVLGSYSTEEKAEKVMELCREQYAENEFNKSLISGEGNDLVISSDGTVKSKKDEFKRKYIFQFPADEEVE